MHMHAQFNECVHIPGTVFCKSYSLSHLMFTAVSWGYCYYPHLTHREIEVQASQQLPNTWQRRDWGWVCSASGSMFLTAALSYFQMSMSPFTLAVYQVSSKDGLAQQLINVIHQDGPSGQPQQIKRIILRWKILIPMNLIMEIQVRH